MPKKVLWIVAAGLVGLLIVTWRVGRYPAQVAVINQSGGVVTEVAIISDSERLDVGTLRSGESRVLKIDPSETLEMTYRTDRERRWRMQERLTTGRSLVLYITPSGRIDLRSGFGSLTR